ncbi:MAG: ferrous iron transport protein A [Phycisphaerae bacterium]|nr:ferrous iron transport protein A [Phycisphaerae bacterium]
MSPNDSADREPASPGCACTGGRACPPVSLCQLKAGQVAVVAEARVEARDAGLLTAMGLCENATIRVCRVGEPCIVTVISACDGGGCSRIGLAEPLARRIFVRAIEV